MNVCYQLNYYFTISCVDFLVVSEGVDLEVGVKALEVRVHVLEDEVVECVGKVADVDEVEGLAKSQRRMN